MTEDEIAAVVIALHMLEERVAPTVPESNWLSTARREAVGIE
jgi:hypothetical protein